MTDNDEGRAGYRAYTTDGTYWTGRKSGEAIEIVRLRAGTYAEVESWGAYRRLGSAVGVAAQLGYLQGRADAQREMSAKLQEALASVGLGPAAAVEAPDLPPGEADAGV